MDSKSPAPMDEEISILTTTWFPNPQEANAIKSNTIARREMIKAIDEEIAVLQARRHALVMACDIGQAIMAPIRKLSVELLTEIFLMCIPPLPTESTRQTPRSQMNPQNVGEVLGSVCRAWHTIVNDEPRIWSTIVLDKEIQDPEYVNQLLNKSKSHPLDIFVKPYFWDQDGNYDVIFAMLRSELWRTRSFIADMRLLGAVSGAIFPQGFSINAPIMQTFTHICDSNFQVEHDLDTFHGPRLCSIILHYSQNLVRSLVANPVQTVRHLEVRFSQGPTALYLQLLSVLPNLISLYWKGKNDREQIQEAPSIVALHSLKSLRLHTTESVMDLLSSLQVPSLECLELLVESQLMHEIICTLCGDGVVKLRRLHVFQQYISESGPDLKAILSQLDCLETLIIEGSGMSDGFLTALSPKDRDFSSLCPQLTTLMILGSEIPLGPFVDFVHRRTRADRQEAVPGLVTSLMLVDGNGSSLCFTRYFARSRNGTIRFMSRVEYENIALGYIFQRKNDWGPGGWGGWNGDWNDD